MNIIEKLEIGYKEDIISNLIVTALRNSEVFRESFFSNIVEIKDLEKYKVVVKPRMRTVKGSPDIVVALKHENDTRLIIIENKLGASEGKEQTNRYSTDECIKAICRNKEIDINLKKQKSIEKYFIYLTLLKENAENNLFKNITYKELIEEVNFEVEDCKLRDILNDFKVFISEFYSSCNVRLEDNLLKAVKESRDSLITEVRVRKIFEYINYYKSDDLKVNKLSFNASAKKYVGIQVWKENWVGDLTNKKDANSLNEDTFNIHLEIAFDVVNKEFAGMNLHYEINPYYSKKDTENIFSGRSIDRYIEKRKNIENKIHKKIEDIVEYEKNTRKDSWLQIAKANINVEQNEKISVEEFLKLVMLHIEKISNIVDDVIIRDKC